jgi:hypothetical protein
MSGDSSEMELIAVFSLSVAALDDLSAAYIALLQQRKSRISGTAAIDRTFLELLLVVV